MNKRTLVPAVLMMAISSSVALANVGWTKIFTDATDWAVGYDPGGHSTITCDGKVAHFYVNSASNMASFIPAPDLAPMIQYDAKKEKAYQLVLDVAGLTPSTSYDVAIDLFNENKQYVTTVWGAYPQRGSTTKTGLITVSLGDLNFDPSTKFMLPKVNVHTGDGGQKIMIRRLEVNCDAAID